MRARPLLLASWGLLLTLFLAQLLFNTTLRSDLSAFLPAGVTASDELLLGTLQEGPAARLWLMSLDGETPEVLAVVSKDLSRRLTKTGHFSQVLNGEEWLDGSAREQLFRWRYLLTPDMDEQYFSVANLRQHLEQRLEDLGSPFSVFEKELIASDPTAALYGVLDQLDQGGPAPEKHLGVWFSEDRKQVLLLAQTRAAGMDMDAQQQVMADIRKSLVRASEGADIRLTLSGAPFFALNSRQQIRSESQQLSIMASLFMILFMAWVYRDARRVLMTALPLMAGVLAGAATVSLFFGYIHGITLAFGITLIGVAIDYPVHVLSHSERSQRLEQAVQAIWPTLRLGVLTTVLGFAAMALTRFTGLAQLGVFAISGLLVAALATRSLLPALPTGGMRQQEPRLMQLASGLEYIRPFVVLQWLTLIVVIILLGLAAQKSRLWSEDIAELSPIPQQLRVQDQELRNRLGSVEPRYLMMLEGASDEAILQKQEQLAPLLNTAIEQGEIDGAQWAAQIIPSMRTQLLRQALLPEQEVLSQSLNAALLELPFRHETFEPFLADVENARQLSPLQPDAFDGTSLGLRLDSLFLEGRQRVGLIHLSGVSEPQAFMERVRDSKFPGIEFVDLKSETNRLVNSFRDEAVERIVWASLIILVILALGLRSLRRLIQVILPILLAVGVSASVPLLLGEQLNLFHLVSMLLVAGIGLDYGLFFSRREPGEIRARTLHALLICAVSTLVVFAMLAASSIPVLHAIGITVSSGVAATFLLAWLFSRPGRSMGEL